MRIRVYIKCLRTKICMGRYTSVCLHSINMFMYLHYLEGKRAGIKNGKSSEKMGEDSQAHGDANVCMYEIG